jgi:hypothetical protein
VIQIFNKPFLEGQPETNAELTEDELVIHLPVLGIPPGRYKVIATLGEFVWAEMKEPQ